MRVRLSGAGVTGKSGIEEGCEEFSGVCVDVVGGVNVGVLGEGTEVFGH